MTPKQRELFIKTRDKVLSMPKMPEDPSDMVLGVEYHDQTEWLPSSHICGTACCFAGWAIMEYNKEITGYDSFSVEVPDDERYDTYADKIMGLSWQEGEDLFDGNNTKEDIARICDEILEAHKDDTGDPS